MAAVQEGEHDTMHRHPISAMQQRVDAIPIHPAISAPSEDHG
jgi:hypothetical protein